MGNGGWRGEGEKGLLHAPWVPNLPDLEKVAPTASYGDGLFV